MASVSDEWSAWIALKLVRGVGNIFGTALVRSFGDPRAVFSASSHALECTGLRRDVVAAVRKFDRWDDVEDQLRRLEDCRARLVTILDGSYPENLRHIRDAPLFLVARGEIVPDDRLAIAIVGSRAVTPYGRRMTAELAEGLSRYGVTIVSGLARGVDAEAHAATLRAGGRTVAVLGCGIDVNYPAEHHQLKMNIAHHGAVVSEFLLGTQPDAENFPGRNRIISGLSLGTVVVEAAEKSGSLISATYATEQGREVFAVPGPIGRASRGVHRLLREGATLVENADDILREIAPRIFEARQAPLLPPLDETEGRVFATLEPAGVQVDDVITRTGLTPAQALDALLRLELRGLVRQLPGKCFARDDSPGGTSPTGN